MTHDKPFPQDVLGELRNSDVDMVASAAIEVAATVPGQLTRAALYSRAMTLALSVACKIGIMAGERDMSVAHAMMDKLWDGAKVTGNSPGGDS